MLKEYYILYIRHIIYTKYYIRSSLK